MSFWFIKKKYLISVLFMIFIYSSVPVRSSESNFKRTEDIFYRKVFSNLESIHTYSLRGYKVEVVKGKQTPPESFIMLEQIEPKAVYVCMTEGPNEGAKAVYYPKKYGEKVQVIGYRFIRFFGVFYLDPKGYLATRGQRHNMTESGIIPMMYYARQDHELRKKYSDSGARIISIDEEEILGQPSICFTFIHPDYKKYGFYSPKSQFCFHKDLYLPTSIKIWDDEDVLVEHYTFQDYTLNIPVTESDFDLTTKVNSSIN